MLVTLMQLSPQSAVAETQIHFIVSNTGGETLVYNTDNNRVKITYERLVIESKDGNREIISWPINECYQFSVGLHEVSDIEDAQIETSESISYDPSAKEISVNMNSEEHINVAVYDLYGAMPINVTLLSGEPVSVAQLRRGIYIAVASDSTNRLTLKFIVN